MASSYDPTTISGLLYGPDKKQYAVTGGSSYNSGAGTGPNVGFNDPRFQYFANALNPSFTGVNDTSAFDMSNPASSIVNSPTPNINSPIAGTTNVALPKTPPSGIPSNSSLTSPNQNPSTPLDVVSNPINSQTPSLMNNPMDRNKRLQTFGAY